jgi:LacI family transcriptional regulator
VIARIAGNQLNNQLKAAGLPVVNVSGICLKGDYFPRICTDLDAGAGMAAMYFKEKGFEHFGYFSALDLPFVRSQQAAFSRHVKLLGHHCSLPASRGGGQGLSDWLAEMPKPFALLTWNAAGAQMALRSCQERGLRVPEEVAILSGTDDDLLCEVSHVPISGIQVSGEEIGFKSAQLLDHLMKGDKPPKAPVLLPPVRVVSRLSTQILAVSDPQLVKALEFIREKAFGRLAVDEISRQAGLSRRMLERRFTALLKRTPAEQIRHVRISKAEELLTKTNLSIPEVAAASGFGSPEYMAFVFRESSDITPLQYRKRYRM